MLRRVARVGVTLGLALLALLLLAAPAAAEDGVRGRLRDDGTPIPGVRITVATTAGNLVGEAVTDSDGEWEIVVPEPGTYRITLDVATLPADVSLRDPDEATVTRKLASGSIRPQLFPLGEREVDAETETNRTAQLIAEGLRFGLLIALASVGLSLIFGTTGLVNFAHGELVTLGAMLAYYINTQLGLHLLAAAALAVAACGLAGAAQDRFFWGVLRRRGSGLLAMMIISIGVALLLRYVFQYYFGGGNDAYDDYRSQRAVPLDPIPVALAPRDYWSMGIAALVLVLVLLWLNRSRAGKAIRAVADNPALARASGIDVDKVIRLVWTLGAGLAGLGGILLAVAQQVNFALGFNILLLMFAAVILGGLGSATGALVGSLIIGLFIQLSTLVVAPELKNVGALGVLIIILLIRPQGILGRSERVG